MKTILSLTLALFTTSMAWAQRPFEGIYSSQELSIKAHVSLYRDTIPVPGLEMDMCYGYLSGRINGTWVILKVKELDDDHALVRAASDRGADAQDLLLKKDDEGNLLIKQA